MGEEQFVDGYGAVLKDANDPTTTSENPSVTINGFHFGGPLGDLNKNGVQDEGDTIVFGVSDWARGQGIIDVPGTEGTTDDDVVGFIAGLVQSDGHTQIGSAPFCPLGFATYGQVGQAGHEVDISGTPGNTPADVILYDIGLPLTNALDLQHALAGAGHFLLNNGGVLNGQEVDILVAYQVVTATGQAQIRIADVTLTNVHEEPDAAAPVPSGVTDTADLNPVVHDLVHINTTQLVGVTALSAHNIDFIA